MDTLTIGFLIIGAISVCSAAIGIPAMRYFLRRAEKQSAQSAAVQ